MTTADAPLPDPPPPMTETTWPKKRDDPSEPAPDAGESTDDEDVDYDGHAGAGPF